MTIWLIEPRDPLIVREGRPFGPDPGASATSLPFPFPSTLAGGARSRSALDENGAFRYAYGETMSPEQRVEIEQHLEALKKLSIRGPLLVELANDGDDIAAHEDAWLVPMPTDAQLLRPTDASREALLRRLVPLKLPEGARTDFEQRDPEKPLMLVGQVTSTGSEKRKPHPPLRYWYWSQLQRWLIDPGELETEAGLPLSVLGREDLVRDYRFHVSMDSEKEMGKDGLLFGTSGLEFTLPGEKEQRLHGARRLALAIEIDDEHAAPLAGLGGFGGERRLVTWRRSTKQFPGSEACLAAIKQAIKTDKQCRVVLLTPACFTSGYYPSWLQGVHAAKCGVCVSVQAIACRRPQVVSGWDLARSQPKPSRRLAPAGTVLFLSVEGSDEALDTWVKNTWMHCISDDEQDRRDGFGLTAVGTWSSQQ